MTDRVDVDDADAITEAWHRERPDLDVASIGIVTRIKRLATSFDRHRQETLRRHGIDPSTLDLLSTLRRAGPPYSLTPGEITARTLLTSGGTSQRIAKAERNGLVERAPAPTDRRSTRVALTKKGHELLDRAVTDVLHSEQQLIDGLDPHQHQQLASTLRQLLAHTTTQPAELDRT